MSDNSYQSARRDALKAAALLGAGYVAYKGYKKLSSISDEEALGIFLVLLFLTAIPAIVAVAFLALPFYVYWRSRFFPTAKKMLPVLESRLENLWVRHSSLQKRLGELPLTDQEQEQGIATIENEQAKVWAKASKCASVVTTHLQWELNKLWRQKDGLVRSVENISVREAKAKIEHLTNELARVESALSDLREHYHVEPLVGWFFFKSFSQTYAVLLVTAVVLLWIPAALVFMDAF